MAHRREPDDRGPERLCVATRKSAPPDEMLRFVCGPENQLVPDLKRNLPGRGVWVSLSADAVREAVKRKAFARSLKTPVHVAPSLPEDVDHLLLRDTLQALSFANKAGEVVTGFTKVESALSKGRTVALLHALEAAPDGVRKVGQIVRRNQDSLSSSFQIINAFSVNDLGLALGGEHVIHAALEAGPASTGFLARWRRLSAYRGSKPDDVVVGAIEPTGDQPV